MNPSLLLIPDRYKAAKLYSQIPDSGDGDLDFARASVATRVNASGLIESVASGVPRLDYTGGGCPSLLLEPQRTNLITFSEQFNNAAWVQEQVTITANATASPDGFTNADKVIANATAGDKYVAQIFTVSIGSAFTTSAYFKSSEYTYAFIRFGGLVSNPYVIYNLATQSVVATTGLSSSSITAVGNGWYRITATITSTTTTLAPVLMVIPSTGYTLGADNIPEFTGDGTSGGFIWGAQLEAGSYVSSYIPTLGSSVTRLAENLSLSTLPNSNMTFSAVLTMASNPIGGTADDWLRISAANILGRAYGYDLSFGFADDYNLGGSAGRKIAWKQESGTTAKIFSNGSLLSTSTTGTYSSPFVQFSVRGGFLAAPLRIESFLFFDSALLDSELATLTSL